MIIMKICGGLGNQMFQYAFARALKEKVGLDIYLDTEIGPPPYTIITKREYGLKYFNITLKRVKVSNKKELQFLRKEKLWERFLLTLSQKGLIPIKTIFDIDKPYQYNEAVYNIKKNTYYFGSFQNQQYFQSIREILLKEFQPRKELLLKKELKIFMEERTTIAVHIRRGDYLKVGMALNKTYYENAMQYILEKTDKRNPIILFFSDDIKWIKKNITIGADCYYVNEDKSMKDYEELILMSKCNHHIISKSTFSWWGAWLNNEENQIVIMPKGWMEYKESTWIEL